MDEITEAITLVSTTIRRVGLRKSTEKAGKCEEGTNANRIQSSLWVKTQPKGLYQNLLLKNLKDQLIPHTHEAFSRYSQNC